MAFVRHVHAFMNIDAMFPLLQSTCVYVQLKWGAPDEEGLIKFMCGEKGFNEERIRSGLAKLKKAKKKGSQRRMDSFFTPKPQIGGPKKRKAVSASKAKGKGKAKASGKRFRR